jgi:outer membrane murein-binding lipoprotein Lpp
MKRFLAAALTIAALSSSAAYACTSEELQAKAMAISTKIQELAKKDPQKASEWSQKFAAQQQAAGQPKSIDEACKFYDDMIAGMPG